MSSLIQGKISLRPRYSEVDQMGYVYHANYVSYCHQARTELLRQYGISDHELEKNNILLPVINMNLKYSKPARYDKKLTITTTISKMPSTRFGFDFEIRNEENELVCTASSTVVFVDKKTRKPMKVPKIVTQAFNHTLPQ